MTIAVQLLLADAVPSGMALLSLGLVGHLLMLRIWERRRLTRSRLARERDDRKHWGYV